MKTLLSTVILAAGTLILLLGCGGGDEPGAGPTRRAICSDSTVNGIATAYAGAAAYPESFPNWALQNKAALESQEFRTCLERFAEQLTMAALSAPSSSDIYAKSMDIATAAGAPELGPKVAEGMAQNSADLLRLANQLRQLLAFLPDVLNGDLTSFEQSDFQLMALAWRMSHGQLGPEYTRRLQKLTFDLSYWYVSVLARQAT
ncbi:MAG: hypothetical protein ACE5HL_02390 [Terriglobia bacterium]